MADLDVLTLDEGKQAIHQAIGNESQEARLRWYISGVSRRLDEFVGPIVQRTVTEYHDGGAGSLEPDQTPVISITSVTEWDGTNQTTLTADTWGVAGNTNGYVLEPSGNSPHGVRIHRYTSGYASRFVSGDRSVRLIYEAGRAATTEDVEERYKFVAAELLQRVWTPSAAAWHRGPEFLANVDAEIGAVSRNPHVMGVLRDWLGDELKPPVFA